ncbi:Mini-ribonuclease 3 [Fuchsiella alkaliacetigena]|uniref:Mini-ribonuclease 3 n=1 Tax=Fuchsiella alkaliacetigena TaxID=957042 RepID=UPI00200B4B25|nr:ribonuclease III domain-containing protein [Fuchsiella alkaliacetigena]MCK8826011.1 ribonuclease III [Fuchsiella alkaliacetigena]
MFNNLISRPDSPHLLSPAVMAYIGDSVYELFIRSYLIEQGFKTGNQLHQEAIKYVNAEAQAELLNKLDDFLNEEEQIIVRRGRNSTSGQVPANTEVLDYRYSTAFEALLGYLYLAGKKERMLEILTRIKKSISETEELEKDERS